MVGLLNHSDGSYIDITPIIAIINLATFRFAIEYGLFNVGIVGESKTIANF